MPIRKPVPAVLPWLTALAAAPLVLIVAAVAATRFGGVDLAAQGHNVLKIVLLALVALHVLGALYHQFVLKDGLINRMRRAEG